jgi:hypothetical protein
MTDYTDLVERLRNHDYLNDYFIGEYGLEAAAAIEALEAENERLKAAFRVNMLRAFSNMTHEEIDAEIDAAILGEK